MSKTYADVSPREDYDVVIVGGGPVGLFLGLVLAQKGFRIVILEAEPDIVQSPRALMYYPIVLHEFEKAGILDEVVQAGYKNQQGLCFRTPAGGSNKVLAQIPPGKSTSGEIDYGVQLGQHRLAEIIRRRAQQYPNLTIRYNTRFTGLREEKDSVEIEAATADGGGGKPQRFSARFVVACDGASSAVRKFLDIPFEGYTWEDWRFLAINIRYDFDKYDGYLAANHIIDAVNWAVIARAGNEKEGLWRIATGIDPKIPIDEIEKHLPAKLEQLLPGPRPLKYEIVACNPYWAHERVAKNFRSGRVVLCGDAAHVRSPIFFPLSSFPPYQGAEQPSRVGKPEVTRRSLDQRCADIGFQPAQRPADGRLLHGEDTSGRRHAGSLSDEGEGADVGIAGRHDRQARGRESDETTRLSSSRPKSVVLKGNTIVSDAIEPLRLCIPQADLDDLHDRLSRIRWPGQETVYDTTQGPKLEKLRALIDHWRDRYDWRRCETRLNELGQHRTTIDGLGIHFLHIRSPEADALPLIMTHGWPGSVLEFAKVVGPLTDPAAHGGDRRDAFHLVLPTLPGFGFSDKPTGPGWGIPRIADAWSVLMERLGYERWVAQGGDWGAAVTSAIGHKQAKGCIGIHLNFAMYQPSHQEIADATPEEQAMLQDMQRYQDVLSGYAKLQATRPQTIGYSLADSPVGQAAWIYAMFLDVSDSGGEAERAFTYDEMLDDIMMYWLPNAGASSARLYWEASSMSGSSAAEPMRMPTAISMFPKELVRISRRWAERRFASLIHFDLLDRGGHFAALEQPQLFVEELRNGFRSLRA
ncbi:MAG: hypothetical protein Q9212_001586 [Teloschistes hypoglaucus]